MDLFCLWHLESVRRIHEGNVEQQKKVFPKNSVSDMLQSKVHITTLQNLYAVSKSRSCKKEELQGSRACIAPEAVA